MEGAKALCIFKSNPTQKCAQLYDERWPYCIYMQPCVYSLWTLRNVQIHEHWFWLTMFCLNFRCRPDMRMGQKYGFFASMVKIRKCLYGQMSMTSLSSACWRSPEFYQLRKLMGEQDTYLNRDVPSVFPFFPWEAVYKLVFVPKQSIVVNLVLLLDVMSDACFFNFIDKDVFL